jgi:hypothetical protein
MFLKSSLQGALDMRTNGQRGSALRFTPMLEDLKAALSRSPATLPGDMAGATALAILLLAALYLPGLV